MRITLFISVMWVGASLAAAEPAVNVVLDGSSGGKVFDGIGAASGGGATSRLLIDYPPAVRDTILDYLFKPAFGASLQMLKVEIGSDGNSTEGAEPTHARTPDERNFDRGYEWWIIEQAKRRNPRIKVAALAWNFPAWVGRANSQATADYLVSFVEGAKKAHHVDIDYLGIWNETKMDVAFIKTLRATLSAHRLDTKIMADDSVNSWDVVPAMEGDAALRDSIDVIATHYPRWLSTPLARTKSEEWRKPLWSSEDGPWGDEWGTAGQQSPPLAQVLNRNYIQGRITSTNIWCLITSYYDAFELPNAGLFRAKTPWSGHYEVASPLWVVAHTTQFAQPGWLYIDSASAVVDGVGSYVTLHDRERYSVVMETLDARQERQFNFRLQGGLAAGPVYVWRSNAQHWFEQVARVVPRDGVFTLTLEPNSVYTITNTTGQHKGTSRPPPDRSFPVPYRDDFESQADGLLAPRYLFEANGAFEVGPCIGGRSGHCLTQMTRQAPVAWTYYGQWPEDGTLATLGDVRWRDYRVAADVRLNDPGYAALYARVARVSSDGVIDGYQFRLYDDGRWELRTAPNEAPIGSGRTSGTPHVWRHVELAVQAERITAAVDDHELISVTNTRHAAGLAGVGDGWNGASFDNFAVVPAAPDVPVISAPAMRAAAQAPELPPELFVPQAADHVVRLSWKPVPGATGYRVSIGTQENVYDKAEEVGNVSSYTFRTLTNGVKYYFGVSAVNELGAGKPATQYAVAGATAPIP